jgi:hypothetical protein
MRGVVVEERLEGAIRSLRLLSKTSLLATKHTIDEEKWKVSADL